MSKDNNSVGTTTTTTTSNSTNMPSSTTSSSTTSSTATTTTSTAPAKTEVGTGEIVLNPQLDGSTEKDKSNVKFGVLIGLIEVGQVSNKEVVNTVLQLVNAPLFADTLLSVSKCFSNTCFCNCFNYCNV